MAMRWSAAAMICTDRLRVKLKVKNLRGGVPVGRFFSLYFCWLLHRADVLHLPITSRLTFLFVVLCVCEWQGCSRTWRSFCRTTSTISIQRAFKLKKPEWPCGWEYKQAFSCLVASSGRLQIKERDVPEIHCTSICPAKLYSHGPSVVPDFQGPNNVTLIFELRSADCLESLPLLSSKTPRKNSSCKFNVSCCCERLPDVRSHLRPRWSRRTINHNASHSTKTACRPRSGRSVELALRSCSDHWSDQTW